MNLVMLEKDSKRVERERALKVLEERLNLEMRLQKLIVKKSKEKIGDEKDKVQENNKINTDEEKKEKCLRLLKKRLELEKRLQELIVSKKNQDKSSNNRK